MTRIAFLAFVLVALTSPLPAFGADHVILGKRLQVSDPSTPPKRRVNGLGREAGTDITALSDPRVAGATLTVIANGGTDTVQSFALDASGWTTVGNGYRYLGPTGAEGDAVKRVLLLRTPTGRASLTILVRGDVGTQGLDVVPPNPGATGGFVLDVAGGDRYCVQLGGAAGGLTKKDDARRWDIRNATADSGCPTPDTTTTTTITTTTTTTTNTTLASVCGNGVREAGEMCDGTDIDPLCPASGFPGCIPAGDLRECECCIQPASLFFHVGGPAPPCCGGGECQPVGPSVCECPGTCAGEPFPTCGGSCSGPRVCVPLTFSGSNFCFCTPIGACEPGTCSGGQCPAGEVCDAETCSCVTL